MQQELYNLLSLITYIISAIIALLMLWSVRGQIKEAVESNKINTLNSLLALEAQIAERRRELSSAGISLGKFDTEEVSEEYTAASLRFGEAVQMYLNGLDRLCYCVKKKYLDNNDMKLEYRTIISEAIADHPEKFTATTIYTNILDINEQWKRS